MKAVLKTIYTGSFISTPTLGTLQVLENHAIGVDENGIVRLSAPLPVPEGAYNKAEFEVNSVRQLGETWGWGRGLEVDWRWVKGGREGSSWWFPGFVDTHIHASQYPNSGIFGKTTLLDWLNTYTFPLESSLINPQQAHRVYTSCVTRTLSHGTTTAAYFATRHVETTNQLADICLAKGQRAFVGRVCMDNNMNPEYYRDASPGEAVEDTRKIIEHINKIDPSHQLITPIITPRFAPSCSSAVLSGLGSLASETKLPIQTHISENTSEIALVSILFPNSSSYADVYDMNKLLTPRTVLAHAVHLSRAERALVKARESKVSHCPVSNTSLSSGLCPVRELLDEGIEVGLGTDVSGGYSSSMLVAAREASMVSRTLAALTGDTPQPEPQNLKEDNINPKDLPVATSAVSDNAPAAKHSTTAKDRKKLSVEEVLYLATRGGAACLGLSNKVGAFEIGMEWDAQLIELGDAADFEDDGGVVKDAKLDEGLVELWGQETWGEKVAKWLFCGDDRNTKMVFVRGRLVHERR